MQFKVPKPLSRPLNMHYTYEDAEKLFQRIADAYAKGGLDPADLDWNKIRRASGDTVYTLAAILERTANKEL